MLVQKEELLTFHFQYSYLDCHAVIKFLVKIGNSELSCERFIEKKTKKSLVKGVQSFHSSGNIESHHHFEL